MSVSLKGNFFLNARGITLLDGGGITWTINKNTNEITGTAAGGAGVGTVTTVSVVTANGVSGSVANPSTTPAITLTLGAITPTSVAASGTVTASNISGSTTGTNTGDQVIPAAANPTAKVGLTAVNGSAGTWMRSDAAPPIDVAIIPTWTGAHTWSAAATFSSTIKASGSPLTAATTRAATGLAAYKASTTQSVTSVVAADAALTLTFNETGVYVFEVYLAFYETTAGTGGFKFDLNAGSVSFGPNVLTFDVTGFSTADLANTAAFVTAASVSMATISTSAAAPSWIRAKGLVNITVTGTWAVEWGQASTLAIDPTNLLFNSYIMATKIG